MTDLKTQTQDRPIRAKAVFLVTVTAGAWWLSALVLPQPNSAGPPFTPPDELRAANREQYVAIRDRVQNAWNRIHAAFEKIGPRSLESLNPPATEQQIVDLETKLGFPLPDDVKCSLKIHNGQDTTKPGCFFYKLLPVQQIEATWNKSAKRDGFESGWGDAIPHWRDWDYWQPDILPVGDDFGVDFQLWIELSTGTVFMWYQGNAVEEADSFVEWLEARAQNAEDGYVEEHEKGFPFTPYSH